MGRNIKQGATLRTKRVFASALVVILLFSNLHLPEWFTFIPEVKEAHALTGDYSIFTQSVGGRGVTTSVYDVAWNTKDVESSNIALAGNNSDIDLADGGKYLVLYNAWTEVGTSTGSDRRSFETYLSLNGVNIPYGRGAGYIRDAGGEDEAAYAAGGAIIDASAGDDLAVHIRRDDTHSAASNIRGGTNGVNVLKLSDSFDYLRIHKSIRSSDISGNTSFTDVTWDTSDEVDTGSFGFTPTSGNITLKGDAGEKFLVTANVRLNQDGASSNRQNYEMRFTLDGAEIDGSRTTAYIRGNPNSHGTYNGTLVYTGIIEKTSSSDQTFNVEVRRESVNSAATDIVADETALSMVALPSNANYIMLSSTSTAQTLQVSRTPLQWDSQIHIDSSHYSHSTSSNNSQINIDTAGDYLFFSTAYTERTSSSDRNVPRIEWRLDGTTVLDYGGHGSFNRGVETGGGNTFTSGSSGGLILPGLTASQYLEVVHSDETGDTPNATFEPGRISLQGVDLTSLAQIDTFVTLTSNQTEELEPSTNNFETGATFAIADNTGSRNVTSITLTESGTIDAQNDLDNIKLYYDLDTSFPYNCASESYGGGEAQFGSTDTNGFTAADGTSLFSGSVSISTTQTMCVYVVLDVGAGARDGETFNIEIEDPSNDVSVSSGTIGPAIPLGDADFGTIRDPEITQAHYHWRNDDGDETSASSATGGVEDTPALAFSTTTPQRLRMSVFADGTGSTSMQFRLEFAEKTVSCSAATGWEDVGTAGGAWEMYDSTHITHGDDTTNIAEAIGGVSDPKPNFESDNNGLLDTSSVSGALVLTDGSERVIGEFGTTTISNGATSTISLSNTYVNPVVVASVRYSRSTGVQRTVRITKKTTSSFDILIDNYDSSLTGSTVVDYLVMEAGEWDIQDGSTGLQVYASSTDVSAVASRPISSDPGGTVETYPTAFSGAPAVVASVASYNDSDWLFASVYDGSTQTAPPSNTTIGLFLNENYETDGHTSNETIDYIAFEQQSGSYGGSTFDFTTSGSANVTDSPVSISLAGFSEIPSVTVVQNLTTNGSDGGYALVDTDNPATSNSVTVAIDEDGGGADRGHGSAEEVAAAAFSGAGNLYVDEIVGDNFVELEYAIQATASSTEGVAYCFRLTDAGTPLRNYDVYPEATLSADVTVSATGTQVATIDENTIDNYVGAAFSISDNADTRDVTSITITEAGTIDGRESIDNIELYYEHDTSAPYDCVGETYNGGETQYGSTDSDGFSSANGTSTFTGSVTIATSSTMCVYVLLDVNASSTNGETIDIEIANPSADVTVDIGSVGPGSAISLPGSTVVAGPLLTQTGYHFRNDDGDEGSATSAAGDENTPISDVGRGEVSRIRIAVSNEGATSSGAAQYRLEYGTKIGGSCSVVSQWFDVDVGSAFEMASTSALVDGDDTTTIGTSTGGITDPNDTFRSPNGGQKEDDSETAGITLTETEFVELEYAISPTTNSAYETAYCFRVTDAGTELDAYTEYPELTTRQRRDFRVQRGTETVSGTSTTLFAGADYIAPSASTSAFVRITNSQITGAGSDTLGAPNSSNNITAYIENPENITTSFTIARPPTATDNTRVSWEIVEYIGIDGADNEMIVRDQGVVTYGGSSFYATGTAVSTVADDSDVVVFITGQLNPDGDRDDVNTAMSISSWNASTSEPVFERGDTDSIAAGVSYAVVEFTGANWSIQRAEHTYNSAGVTETEPITAISSISRAFLHTQKLAGDELFNLDEMGHEVWISSIGFISFELESGATNPSSQRSVAWLIENTQIGTGEMNVYQSDGYIAQGASQPLTYQYNIGGTVSASNASLFINNRSSGSGDFHPRTILGATIISNTQYELWKSDEGQNQTFRAEVVDWPVAELSIRQNYYRFYVDSDTLTPTDAWPPGGGSIGENTPISDLDEPLGEGERIRIRMSLFVNNASFVENSKTFKLQYGRRTGSCGAVSQWNDLGDPGSGEIWRGYNASPSDGATVPSTLLTPSDHAGTYEEQNNTALNPNTVDVGEDIEYDWLVENNGALQKSSYCFRMVEGDGTELSGYDNYPTARTSGFTPVSNSWIWFDDEYNETPTTTLAATNTAPIDIGLEDVLKLRVVVSEIEGAPGDNVKYKLQYSEFSDFRDGGTTLTATTSCAGDSLWCYGDGVDVDNATITTAVFAEADSCVGSVGNGCGTHNEAEGLSSDFDHGAFDNVEFEFTLQHAGARVNTVYYFRLYDETNGAPVLASTSYPSVVTEGATVELSVSSIASSTVIEGVTTDVDATPTRIDFGALPIGTELEAAQRITVDTNGTEGYQVFLYAYDQLVSNQGERIPAFSASNTAPAAWTAGCPASQSGCFGYHSGDDLLSGGSNRFAPDDTYAGLETTMREVAHSDLPAIEESVDIIYKMEVTELQAAGTYETGIVYIIVPKY